jgi:hypothetical protein
MEKIIQEFRIIETDDGFRIEIKGDKEQLREWVMRLDPRHWGGPGPGMRFAFGPHHGWHGRRGRRFGPFGFGAWWCDEDEEDEAEASKAKRSSEEAV